MVYAYDFDRLVSRAEDADGAGSGDATVQHFVYDGDQIILRLSPTGDVKDRYLWGPAADQLLADEQIRPAESGPPTVNTLWALTDHQNSVRDLVDFDETNGTAAVVDHVIYEAFGQPADEGSPTAATLFGFTGRLFDRATSLQYNSARWLDPNLPQWLSEDPILFAAGDPNPRRYAGNDPVNSIDPSGLDRIIIENGNVYWQVQETGWGGWWNKDVGERVFLGTQDHGDVVLHGKYVEIAGFATISGLQQMAARWNLGDFHLAPQPLSDAIYTNIKSLHRGDNVLDSVVDTFVVETGLSFADGRAWDSLQGGAFEYADQAADLGFALINSLARELGGMSKTVGLPGDWQDLKRENWFGRLADFARPLYGHEAEYQDGRHVGYWTIRAQAAAVMVWEAGAFVRSAPAMLNNFGAWLAGSGGVGGSLFTISGGGAALNLEAVASALGVIAQRVAVVSAAGVAVNGGARSGALDPLSNWAFAETPKPSARLPAKGTPARAAIEAARMRGIRLKQAEELANIRTGGKGSGVWTEPELEQIRRTGQFPQDAKWHHDPTVANRPDLAADPSVVRPVRGGVKGHLDAHGGNWHLPLRSRSQFTAA